MTPDPTPTSPVPAEGGGAWGVAPLSCSEAVGMEALQEEDTHTVATPNTGAHDWAAPGAPTTVGDCVPLQGASIQQGRPQAATEEVGIKAAVPTIAITLPASPRTLSSTSRSRTMERQGSPKTPSPEGIITSVQRPASNICSEQDCRMLSAQRAATPRPSPRPSQGAPCARSRRFRPGCIYVRHNPRGQRTTTASTATAPTQQNEAANFINTVTIQTAEPLLQGPPQATVVTRRRKKKALAPMRKSVRIAAASWPKGDAQAKARQVLMKKLGFMEDGGSSKDNALLGYFKLFGGPLSQLVIKALTALCGLDDGRDAGCTWA